MQGSLCAIARHTWTTPVSAAHSIPFRDHQPGSPAHPVGWLGSPAAPPTTNLGCATTMRVRWLCQGGGSALPSLPLPINPGQEGLSLRQQGDGAQAAKVSVHGRLRLPIAPCPTQAPPSLRLLRLVATNMCWDSMESVAETGMGRQRQSPGWYLQLLCKRVGN